MLEKGRSVPAFGEADLSNCEREQIHLAGSIQPHGALLVIRESDHRIIQASENAAPFLGFDQPLTGRRLADLDKTLAQQVKSSIINSQRNTPFTTHSRLEKTGAEFHILIHRVHENALVLEFECGTPPPGLTSRLEGTISRLISEPDIEGLCEEAAVAIKEMTGYDRVMVYKFDPEGHGQVIAEKRKAGLESYLGNWYPASDIPQIARRLYERNRVRMLVDVGYAPVPLSPRAFPITGADLDMSLCFLRSMSPIHLEYLKNMGVSATLVASLMVGRKLWGLIACHHYSPRHTQYELRTACEIIAEVMSTRIASLESFARARIEMSVRRLEDMMLESVSLHGDWKSDLFDDPRTLLEPVGASGVALISDGELHTAGEVPSTHDLRQLTAWSEKKIAPANPVFATKSLGLDDPQFANLVCTASGVLATPIPDTAGDFLFWFRPERRHTVTWGGDPMKPFEIGNNPSDLSPRRSFAQWHQVVEGNALPWTPANIATARMIAASIADVILQFRTLRLLITHDQLDRVRRQVRFSEQLAIVADRNARVLMSSSPFHTSEGMVHRPLKKLDDVASLFLNMPQAQQMLTELVENRKPWRGEAALKIGPDRGKPMLVRGDVVFSRPDTVLGYILLFTDMSDDKAADLGRRQSLRSVVDAHDPMSSRLGAEERLDYMSLISIVVANAKRAVLEITDGIDVETMPMMIKSVNTSVARAAELIENLIANEGQRSDPEPRRRRR